MESSESFLFLESFKLYLTYKELRHYVDIVDLSSTFEMKEVIPYL